eukprot:CAMPEP_0119547020 /NCGR_PEP_ID=MMETSP1352-20130426/1239_1 /TAXON_ID=265584 /ORGANISM="Stauroneis constricta, Strain CCMP1120" /LENGTH=251 /DNA_ID=CAMNT_0007591823 /DNA_START=250 /DNA_END=1005 /DNA_ORIENTATION=-
MSHRLILSKLGAKAAVLRQTRFILPSAAASSFAGSSWKTTQHQFHSSAMTLEKQTIKVPTMGDSITEGTIVEWVAQVGQAVQPDDVVVLVETDKVTIDIKAEKEGVVTAQFGGVDDTVEVGADLYEIDSDAVATVTADSDDASGSTDQPSAESTTPKTVEDAPIAAASSSDATKKPPSRVPSIKFLGKEGWANRLSPSSAEESSDSPIIYGDLPPNYGRPVFTEEEMDALVLGGANLVPEVRQQSGGAIFG